MRVRPFWLVVLISGACAGLVGCAAKSAEDKPDASGAAGGGGADGGGGAAGAAGTGATDGGGRDSGDGAISNGACGDVPVNGVCSDNQTVKACLIPETPDPNSDPERVITSPCPAGMGCCDSKVDPVKCKIAQCILPPGQCLDSDTRCANDVNKKPTILQVCRGSGAASHWVDTPCVTANDEQCVIGRPGTPAKCVALPHAGSLDGGAPDKLTGTIQFEFRPVKDDRTGWGDLKVFDAQDVYVGIFDNDVLIGKTMTGWQLGPPPAFVGGGTFEVELISPVTDNTYVWVWPMAFDYQTGVPLMAIAKATSTDMISTAGNAKDYWAWGAKVKDLLKPASTTDMNPFVIREADGSGALNIYTYIDFGLIRTNQMPGAQKSLIVYWDPAVGTPNCGACFCGPQCGGGVVRYGSTEAEVDRYDSWITLGGPSSEGSTQWATSVISHEFGHYVMMNYSLSPGEGGKHYVGQASKPGLAYSEAWATSFGQTNIQSPIYVDEQQGTTFWVDLSKYAYSGGDLVRPDRNGPIDQDVNENIGAGMLWKLWVPPDKDADGRSLGDPKIFTAFTYGPLVDGTLNRGYPKVDLVDFFDALLCSGQATAEDVTAVVTAVGFPYQVADKPPCP